MFVDFEAYKFVVSHVETWFEFERILSYTVLLSFLSNEVPIFLFYLFFHLYNPLIIRFIMCMDVIDWAFAICLF